MEKDYIIRKGREGRKEGKASEGRMNEEWKGRNILTGNKKVDERRREKKKA